MQHILKISFTLLVLPENEPFYHVMSVMVLLDACKSPTFLTLGQSLFCMNSTTHCFLTAPPVFQTSCSQSGITFKLDHRPFDYLWEICIGSDVLTPQLAARHGYIMSNDSQQLQLDVPLFAHGYKYEVRKTSCQEHQFNVMNVEINNKAACVLQNISLKGFSGTFEILVRDPETSNIQSSTVKTCSFTATEYISKNVYCQRVEICLQQPDTC